MPAIAAPVVDWSATLAPPRPGHAILTVTPAAGGVVLVQFERLGVWANVPGFPFTSFFRGAIPPDVTGVRALSGNVEGTFEVSDDGAVDPLTPAQISALQNLLFAGNSLATGIVLFNSNEVKTRSSLNDGSDNQVGAGFHDIFVPGGLLGPNGQILVAAEISKTVDGANKNVGLYSGGSLDEPFGLLYSWTGTSPANWQIEWSIYNANDAASQKWRGSTLRGAGSSAGFITSSTPVDTNNPFTLRFAGKWGAASISGEQIAVASLLAIGYYGA